MLIPNNKIEDLLRAYAVSLVQKRKEGNYTGHDSAPLLHAARRETGETVINEMRSSLIVESMQRRKRMALAVNRQKQITDKNVWGKATIFYLHIDAGGTEKKEPLELRRPLGEDLSNKEARRQT